MKPMIDRDTHLHALKIVGQAYVSAHFDKIFPLLAEDCVWSSQWRLDSEDGRDQVIRYFKAKEEAFIGFEHTCRFAIVELVGDMNLNPSIDSNGKRAYVGLFYPEGKLCIYMEQDLDGQINGTIIDLTLNEDGLITRIDLCMPELFRFKKYEG